MGLWRYIPGAALSASSSSACETQAGGLNGGDECHQAATLYGVRRVGNGAGIRPPILESPSHHASREDAAPALLLDVLVDQDRIAVRIE